MKNLSIILALIIFSCNNAEKNKMESVFRDIIKEHIDTIANPADDFYQYSCGNWLKNNPIPASERSWGIWSLVEEESMERLRKVSEEAMNTQAEKGSSTQKLGDFYRTGMDSVQIEQFGIQPLKEEFEKINAIKTKEDLFNMIAIMQIYGADPLFGFGIAQDEMNSEIYSVHLWQGGLGLPNRDYYFNTDERTVNIRKEYLLHIKNMFQLLGDDSIAARKNAETVFAIEKNLAASSRKLEDLRDPYRNYNKMSVAGVNKLTPSINWKNLLEKMSVKDIDTVIVGQPEFYKMMEKQISSNTIDNWKTYLRWNLIGNFASTLSSAFDKEDFHFYGTVLTGTKEQRPRWKRVLEAEEDAMGEILGQLYVQKYYSEKTKKRYEQLTENVLNAFEERIKKLDWMSDSTKAKALEKLNKVTRKVGYPAKWKDYSAMEIDRSSYTMNILRANRWYFNYQVQKLFKPIDRTEWEMTPQTWNAYYNPSNNEIVLPAAIFIIPEMADSLVDDAVIYGYGGASTIGHEITHGFDDEGRQFDAEGNLREWWTKTDEEKFTKRTELMIQQFSSYVVLDNMYVNGKATLGENIADFGGLLIALDAFKKTEQYQSGKMISGLTPLQRFFLGYALSWLGHQRTESLARQILTDVHSPNFIRINGPISDIDAFYESFNVQPGNKLYRPDSLRVKIW